MKRKLRGKFVCMSVLYEQRSGEKFVARLHCPLFEVFCCVFCFPFQVCVPCTPQSDFLSKAMGILVQDLLGECGALAVVLFKLQRCIETIS